MKSVEQVLSESSPATVNYRNANNRESLKDLIDSGVSSTPRSQKKLVNGKEKKLNKLNWVNGVFIPVLLNIWGVIMFLRLGFVVGQAGLIQGTLVIIGSNVVTGLTALSLCAICTNGEVQGGGVYFLISRALGPVYGGTIGILFYVAQAVAVSLYVVGFSEAVVDLYEEQGAEYLTGGYDNDIRVVGIVTVTLLFLMSLIGIGWYAKTQTGLLVILIIAILSVFLGAFFPNLPSETTNRNRGFIGFSDLNFGGELRNLGPNYQVDPDLPSVDQNFFSVFAVFFPAVTGIMAGANLSGDLDDASKAIPKGTLRAIGVTSISYIMLLWLIGLTCLACVDPNASDTSIENLTCVDLNLDLVQDEFNSLPAGLLYDNLIMKNVSLFSPLVYIGVFAATLSSALASLVGAPRILQSVANDKLFPFKWVEFFGKGRGSNNEPIHGYCLTFAIAAGCVLIGSLDIIAPIITNFFMISYALTNYACFASSNSKAPNWRPSFKYFNKYLSLLGAVLCIVVMFLIEWITSLVTVIFACIIWLYLRSIDPDINWGEAGEAKKYTQAIEKLEILQLSQKEHVKTFRPQFLVMTGDIFSKIALVKFVSMMQGGGGVMILADIADANSVANEQQSSTAASSHESKASEGENSDRASPSVRDLFNKDKNDENLSIEQTKDTAKQLSADFDYIQNKRSDAYKFLNNRTIWGTRRCKGAFYESMISDSLFTGFEQMLQVGGIGKIRPNTVVFGFKSDYLTRSDAEVDEYERMLRGSLAMRFGLLVVRDDKNVFDISLTKARPVFHPAFDRIIIRSNSDSVDSKKDTEKAFSGMMENDFQNEVETDKNNDPIPKSSADVGDESLKRQNRIEKYRNNDLEFIKSAENELSGSISGQNIDVWWLADDGGLTMLLPQLLIQNPVFRNKKLRVMAVTSKFQNAEETQRLKKAEFRMVHLLHKFRIQATTVGVDLKLDQSLQNETKEKFEKSLGMPINELLPEEQTKTQYNLRLSEEMRKTSRGACMIFMILPIPESNLRVKLHTVWLDMLSYDMPPMIMMRGNNDNVLTFFC